MAETVQEILDRLKLDPKFETIRYHDETGAHDYSAAERLEKLAEWAEAEHLAQVAQDTETANATLRRRYRSAQAMITNNRATLQADLALLQGANPPNTLPGLRTILTHTVKACEDEMQIMAGLLDVLRLSGIVLDDDA